MVLDVGLHLKNLGSSTLVARNLRLDIRYRNGELGGASFQRKLAKGLFRRGPAGTLSLKGRGREGRLVFPGSLAEDLGLGGEAVEAGNPRSLGIKVTGKKKEKAPPPVKKKADPPPRGWPVLSVNAFVQPGVDQRFGFVTALPAGVSMVLLWGAFEYAQQPSLLQRCLLWLSRQLGLVQFTLDHIERPHSVERVFEVGDGL